MVLMSLFAGQQWRPRHREQTWTQWGKERKGQKQRVALKHIHYHTWNREQGGMCYMTQGAQLVPCDTLEGLVRRWGWGGGIEVQEEACTHSVTSHSL